MDAEAVRLRAMSKMGGRKAIRFDAAPKPSSTPELNSEIKPKLKPKPEPKPEPEPEPELTPPPPPPLPSAAGRPDDPLDDPWGDPAESSGWRESLAVTMKVATMLADSRADADTIVTALIADLFCDAGDVESGSSGAIIGRGGGGGDGVEMEGALRDRLEFVRSNFGSGVAELTAHRLYLGSVTDPLGAAASLMSTTTGTYMYTASSPMLRAHPLLHFNVSSLHLSSLRCTSLHFSSLLFASLHFSLPPHPRPHPSPARCRRHHAIAAVQRRLRS